jgi:DNA-binding LacI/PurR family transcriptional regulator
MEIIQRQPVYLQLKNILLEKISSGVYPAGSCLPSERALGEIYHVSRVSIRKALQSLAEEGYIEKSANKRSMVRETGEKTGRLLAFASMHSRSAMLDVYRMYFESLLMKCYLRGDNLYYLDFGAPLPDVVKNMRFAAVFSTSNHESMLEKISDLSGCPPWIALDCVSDTASGRSVGTDNAAGGRMAANYLLARGYKNLLFLGVEPAYVYRPFTERKEAFLSEVRKHQAECRILDIPNALPETVDKFLSQELNKNRPDVIFAFNDRLAISILKILYLKRIRVPDEISVMGFDGLEIGKYLSPALTTVAQPVQEITDTALSWLNSGAFTGESLQLAPKILDMESVGLKKAGCNGSTIKQPKALVVH